MSSDPEAGAAPVASGLRILVVDDNADMLETLSILLGHLGHEVLLARDGLEALARMERELPQVVLLDVGMPILDGYSTASRARGSAARSNMYLIAMTGWGRPEDIEKALESGFDMHITKPFDTDALRALLCSLVFPRIQRDGVTEIPV